MIAQTDAPIILLDTCVLAPMPLCDTLLRLAEAPAFYVPRWSAGILEELRRVLRRMEYSETQAERRIAAMQNAFEDACITGYAQLIPTMKSPCSSHSRSRLANSAGSGRASSHAR